jgi:hypothetical protein
VLMHSPSNVIIAPTPAELLEFPVSTHYRWELLIVSGTTSERKLGAMTMLSGIRLTVSSLALCVATSAGAQESLEKGKTAAQLYASDCARCHKSPQSVTKTTGGLGLESFLGVHYAATPESAATIAAYLKGLESGQPGLRVVASPSTRRAKRSPPSRSRANPKRTNLPWTPRSGPWSGCFRR